MLAVSILSVLFCGYWLYSGRALPAISSLLTATVAVLVFRRLKDAPRAV
jgi:hypothetical protein